MVNKPLLPSPQSLSVSDLFIFVLFFLISFFTSFLTAQRPPTLNIYIGLIQLLSSGSSFVLSQYLADRLGRGVFTFRLAHFD